MAMSAKDSALPTQYSRSPNSRDISARHALTLSRWRAICLALDSFLSGRLPSRRAVSAASQRPSAMASQRLTAMRSRDASGINLCTGDNPSRYSTMTRESNTLLLSSTISVGTFPSGLRRVSSGLGTQGSAFSSSSSSFFSAATIRTLRANGLVEEWRSFITVFLLLVYFVVASNLARSIREAADSRRPVASGR